MNPEEETGKLGFRKILVLSFAVLAVAVGVALLAGKRSAEPARASTASAPPAIPPDVYGFRLMAQTSELMGPDVTEPGLRYAGNRLSCASCHVHAGDEPGWLNLYGAANNYPKFSARTATIRTLEIRINECMSRSMNGRQFPPDSALLAAIAAWVRSLAARDVKGGGKASDPFQAPERTAKVFVGKQIYEQRCATCHGYNGAGLLATSSPIHGYVFPPVWGPDSFNTGSGMHRLLTAAPFIKARMPLGRPDLTDDEAYDVAAYINAQPRPEMANLESDFPDKRTKLIDAPYPPFIDPFPLEQHRLGPFQPIEAYYKKLRTAN